ncbi:MAG: hypothetical protein MZW92_54315 [Comamonadaceae bacterium]|nr:hypothetical protein [Comamonadaceae bacterium]
MIAAPADKPRARRPFRPTAGRYAGCPARRAATRRAGARRAPDRRAGVHWHNPRVLNPDIRTARPHAAPRLAAALADALPALGRGRRACGAARSRARSARPAAGRRRGVRRRAGAGGDRLAALAAGACARARRRPRSKAELRAALQAARRLPLARRCRAAGSRRSHPPARGRCRPDSMPPRCAGARCGNWPIRRAPCPPAVQHALDAYAPISDLVLTPPAAATPPTAAARPGCWPACRCRPAPATSASRATWRSLAPQLAAAAGSARQGEEIARLRAEAAEREQQHQLATRELDSFAHSVSHDLRAPLRVVDGFATILMEDYAQAGRLIDDLGAGAHPPHHRRRRAHERDDRHAAGDVAHDQPRSGARARQPVAAGARTGRRAEGGRPLRAGSSSASRPTWWSTATARCCAWCCRTCSATRSSSPAGRRCGKIEVGAARDAQRPRHLPRARQRRRLRPALRRQDVRPVPALPLGQRVPGHRRRPGHRAAHRRASTAAASGPSRSRAKARPSTSRCG